MGIPIHGKLGLYIETGPKWWRVTSVSMTLIHYTWIICPLSMLHGISRVYVSLNFKYIYCLKSVEYYGLKHWNSLPGAIKNNIMINNISKISQWCQACELDKKEIEKSSNALRICQDGFLDNPHLDNPHSDITLPSDPHPDNPQLRHYPDITHPISTTNNRLKLFYYICRGIAGIERRTVYINELMKIRWTRF